MSQVSLIDARIIMGREDDTTEHIGYFVTNP